MDSAFNIIGKILAFIGIISILSTLSVWLVFFFIILIMISSWYESKMREEYVKWDMNKAPIERRSNYLINMIEDFTYGKEIRIFGLRRWITNKVEFYLQESQLFYENQVKNLTKAQYFSAIINCILEAVSYICIAVQVVRAKIGIGDFTMYVSTMLKFSNAMQDVMKSILDIRQFAGYYEALVTYIDVPMSMYQSNKCKIGKRFETIEFRNVSFKYPGQSSYSLENINIIINAGTKLALIGENGAGKSTFIKLLCRLYNPTEGEILVDGINIKDIDYESYMKLLGVVFQDYKLFSFSIKENICFNREENDEKIWNILSNSGLMSRVQNLNNGINTSIYKNFNENGFEPSGGEGQKIALARAIYKEAPLVILDEPTAALDPKAEYELYQKFHELVHGKTAIYISHRMSSVRFCDKILVLDKGKIVEVGSHEDLMEEKGLYYTMFRMQAYYYETEKN